MHVCVYVYVYLYICNYVCVYYVSMYVCTVEHSLSGLIWTVIHPDMQNVLIIKFF